MTGGFVLRRETLRVDETTSDEFDGLRKERRKRYSRVVELSIKTRQRKGNKRRVIKA